MDDLNLEDPTLDDEKRVDLDGLILFAVPGGQVCVGFAGVNSKTTAVRALQSMAQAVEQNGIPEGTVTMEEVQIPGGKPH